MKNMYTENCKMLMKEIGEDTPKCLWIGRISIVKMPILPKVIYTFNEILIKMPMAYFTELGQILLKLVWSHK